MTTATNATPINIRRTLQHSHLDSGQISEVIDLLSRAGIVAPEIDKLLAASVNHVNALENEARLTAHRLNLPISAAGEISEVDLARGLAGLPVESRLRYKSMFAACGMIRP